MSNHRDISTVNQLLVERGRVPLRLRHRISPPDIVHQSILASLAWNVGVMRQDAPISFYVKVGLLTALIISSVLHRIF